MKTELREFRESAESLCSKSWCPACSGQVEPALQLAPDLILCPCNQCGYMLAVRDLAPCWQALMRLSHGDWKLLLRSHGREIKALRHAILFDDEPPAPVEAEPVEHEPSEFLNALWAALAGFALVAWQVVSLVRGR